MDKDEKYKIEKCLPKLIEMTICSPLLISILQAEDIIGSADKDLLESNMTNFAKNKKMYEIITTRVGAFQTFIKALQETRQTGVISLLTDDVLPASSDCSASGSSVKSEYATRTAFQAANTRKRKYENSITNIISFNLPIPCKYFTGREQYLNEMIKTLEKRQIEKYCVITISGLGGVGKTQLARMFIKNMREHIDKLNEDLSVIWLNAETEEGLWNDFEALKEKLNVKRKFPTNTNVDHRSVLKLVYENVIDINCVFVFDNAKNMNTLTSFLPFDQPYMSKKVKKPIIIIISRCSNWPLESNLAIELDAWSTNEAENFIKEYLHKDCLSKIISQDSIEIHMLIDRLERHPLAIFQALEYIKSQFEFYDDYNFGNYLHDFETHTQSLLNSKQLRPPHKNVYVSLNEILSTITQLKPFSPTAIKILEVLTCYAFDEPVSCDLLCLLDTNIQAAIKLLKQYSMIRLITNGTSFVRINRLVYDVVKTNMKSNVKKTETFTLAYEIVRNSVNHCTVKHLKALWSNIRTIDNIVNIFSDIPSKIVSYLIHNDCITEAYELAQYEMQHLERILVGEQRLAIIIMKGLIGEVYFIQRQFTKAEDILNLAIKDGLKLTRSTNPALLTIKQLVSRIKMWTHEYLEACTILRETVTDWEIETMGKVDIRHIDCLSSLAKSLFFVGKDYESRKYFEEVLQKYTALLGEHHFKVQSTKIFVRIFTKAYDCPLYAIGNEITLKFKNCFELPGVVKDEIFQVGIDVIGFIYYQACFVQEALNLCKYTFDKAVEVCGGSSLQAIRLQNMYAHLLVEKGLYDEGMEFALKAYDIIKQEHNQDTYELLTSKRIVGAALLGKEYLEEAISNLSTVGQQIKQLNVTYCLEIFWTKIYLAQALQRQKKISESCTVIAEVQNELSVMFPNRSFPMLDKKISENFNRIKSIT